MRHSFEFLGYVISFLLKSENEKHLYMIFEKINNNYLSLDSTFLLDNSIKIVDKCDKYPFVTLHKVGKLRIIMKLITMMISKTEVFDSFKISILRSKYFEILMCSIYKFFGLSLFFLDCQENDFQEFHKSLKNFHVIISKKFLNFNVNSSSIIDKNLHLSFFEIFSFFQILLEKEQEIFKRKIHKLVVGVLLEIHSQKGFCRVYEEFFLFLIKILKIDTFDSKTSVILFKNSLRMVVYSFQNDLFFKENSLKVCKRINNELFHLLFKRPKSNLLETIFSSINKFEEIQIKLVSFIYESQKCHSTFFEIKQNEEIIKNIFLIVVEQEIKFNQSILSTKNLKSILNVKLSSSFKILLPVFESLEKIFEKKLNLIILEEYDLLEENRKKNDENALKKILISLNESFLSQNSKKLQIIFMLNFFLQHTCLIQSSRFVFAKVYVDFFCFFAKDHLNYMTFATFLQNSNENDRNHLESMRFFLEFCWKTLESMNNFKGNCGFLLIL